MNHVTRRLVPMLAGFFGTILAATAQCTATWDDLGGGANARINALAALPDGSLVAGGDFVTIGGVAANRVARWDGTTWAPLGAGMDFPVHALLVTADGTLIAGGAFTFSGTGVANHVARWNGTTWAALGGGTNGQVSALVQMPNGDLVAAGMFSQAGNQPVANIARWDGTTWSPIGTGLASALLRSAAVLPNGDLVIGGLVAVGGLVGVVRWDGVAWSGLGGGMSGGGFTAALALAALPGGDLVAGGTFTSAGGVPAPYIARWNGTAWAPLGSGVDSVVYALTVLPGGDLVAGGLFTTAGGGSAPHLARWNGTQWTALATGVDANVLALTVRGNGDLVAGGDFTTVQGAPAAHIARRATSCPASAVAYGTGCQGPAGPTALAAVQLPWLGSTFRAVATGMSAQALAVGAFAFQPLALPMPAVHPLGVPGCTLLVGDDILFYCPAVGGSVPTAIAIPPAAGLVGGVFHHQVVFAERDGTGQLTALTSTGALTLTIGAW